jgi:multidrug efflux pump subunit AcrA (membrane-fusion protein)
MKKILIIILVVFVVVVVLGGATAYRIYRKMHTVPAQSVDEMQAESGIPVRVFPVESVDLNKTVVISGSIEALKTVTIAPDISEYIEAIPVQTGQEVKWGDLLVSLDAAKSKLYVAQAQASLGQAEHHLEKLRNGSRPEEIEAARARMEEARAMYNLAQIERERQQNLYAEEATTQQQLQDAENRATSSQAAWEGARAQYELLKKGAREEDIRIGQSQVELAKVALAQAQENLEDHYLRAPFDGVVSMRLLEPGDLVDFKESIFQLLQIDKVYLVLEVSELYIPRLKISQQVEVTIDTLENRTFTGTVAQINPISQATDRSYVTKILIDNADGDLLPGMFGRAHIVTERIEQALTVSTDAVRSENGQDYMLIVDENMTAQKQVVSLGDTYNDKTHIMSGLKEGDKVISLAQTIVKPGTKVKVSGE